MARTLWPSSAACVQVGNLAKCLILYYICALELLFVLLGWYQRARTEGCSSVENVPSPSSACVTGHGI